MNERLLSPLFTWRSAVASRESGLSPTQRHVALTLSLHMSEKGDSCFPSMARLVDETGLGLSTIREAMRRLAEQGWLEREVSHERGRTNRYRALVPDAYRQELAVSDTASSQHENRQELAAIPPTAGGEDVIESDSEDLAPRSRRERARDELWDKLADVFGPVADKTNAHAKRNKAIGDLRKLGASPDSIDAALAAWPRLFDGAAVTDVALATHYPQLAATVDKAQARRRRSKPCDECGTGGGLHAAGCGKAAAA